MTSYSAFPPQPSKKSDCEIAASEWQMNSDSFSEMNRGNREMRLQGMRAWYASKHILLLSHMYARDRKRANHDSAFSETSCLLQLRRNMAAKKIMVSSAFNQWSETFFVSKTVRYSSTLIAQNRWNASLSVRFTISRLLSITQICTFRAWSWNFGPSTTVNTSAH